MLKKDNLVYGLILGLLAPMAGLLLLKFYKLGVYSFKEVFDTLMSPAGHSLLSAGLTISLLINALLVTLYVNGRRDKTAKGIFITTMLYAVVILLVKYIA